MARSRPDKDGQLLLDESEVLDSDCTFDDGLDWIKGVSSLVASAIDTPMKYVYVDRELSWMRQSQIAAGANET